MLRRQAVFEGGGSLEFFQVPGLYRGREIGNFSSLRAYIEGERSEVLYFPGHLYREKAMYDDSHLASLFQVPYPIHLKFFQAPRAYKGGELGIFLSLRVFM